MLASFNVEAFSLERLQTLTMEEITERYQLFKAMSAFEDLPLGVHAVMSSSSWTKRARFALKKNRSDFLFGRQVAAMIQRFELQSGMLNFELAMQILGRLVPGAHSRSRRRLAPDEP